MTWKVENRDGWHGVSDFSYASPVFRSPQSHLCELHPNSCGHNPTEQPHAHAVCLSPRALGFPCCCWDVRCSRTTWSPCRQSWKSRELILYGANPPPMRDQSWQIILFPSSPCGVRRCSCAYNLWKTIPRGPLINCAGYQMVTSLETTFPWPHPPSWPHLLCPTAAGLLLHCKVVSFDLSSAFWGSRLKPEGNARKNNINIRQSRFRQWGINGTNSFMLKNSTHHDEEQ